MSNPQDELRAIARRLLAERQVDVLLGFEAGTFSGQSRPCVLRTPEDADRLVWNNTCSNNLTAYLPEYFQKKPLRPGQTPAPLPRVGIVVKGCDALSVALLVSEKQAPRENLVVIGMPCQGIVDSVSARLFACCEECVHPVAENADLRVAGESRKPAAHPSDRVREFAAKSAEERWSYFQSEMAKCIRCYACRQVCPNCYCKECFADKTNPRWLGVGPDASDTMLYQLGRMMHQAGRCVGCDACLRACPMGVDLRTFTRKLAADARELFDFEADFAPEPLLSRFKDSDANSFITDPEKKG